MFSVVYFGFYCPDRVCALSPGSPTPPYTNRDEMDAYMNGEMSRYEFHNRDLLRDYDFDIEGEEVLVFLHIQKTGGTTFGKHLVKNMQLENPCKCFRGRKRCDCYNSSSHIWLFSRFSVGWPCGLHADWTELTNCVETELDKQEDLHRKRK